MINTGLANEPSAHLADVAAGDSVSPSLAGPELWLTQTRLRLSWKKLRDQHNDSNAPLEPAAICGVSPTFVDPNAALNVSPVARSSTRVAGSAAVSPSTDPEDAAIAASTLCRPGCTASSIGAVTNLDPAIAARLKRNASGLFVVQERGRDDVSMVARMDDDALARALKIREATFFLGPAGVQQRDHSCFAPCYSRLIISIAC